MFYRYLLTQLMLWKVSMATTATVAQTCVWKDGSVADNYLPCTNSTATSGSCCLSGESCLGSGLCYGSLGLVYRGACINTWGGDCPTYCDDIGDEWINLYPCPFSNSGSAYGPQSFWCGALNTTTCESSSEAHFITIVPSIATKILISTSAASVASSTGPATTSGAVTTSATAATTSGALQASNSATASSSSNNGTAIGLGVGLGVLALACVGVGFWAYRSHRKQKEQFELLNASVLHQGQNGPTEFQPKTEMSNYGSPAGPPPAFSPGTETTNYNYGVHREMDGAPPPTELDGGRADFGGR